MANIILQYVAVGAVIAASLTWIAFRIYRTRKRPSSCGECTLCTSVQARKNTECSSSRAHRRS